MTEKKMNLEIFTIGVYGFDADSFFQALQTAGVDAFCDVRARRGVRGADYAFANSQRLQARLADMGVRYFHFPQLAPSKAIRQQQYAIDRTEKTAKRQRTILAPAFIAAYQRDHLADFDSDAFVAALGPMTHKAALFCVEREPAACHRSLLAARLADDLGLAVTHLLPA